MKTVKRAGQWWITEVPGCLDCGPYETKDEAEDNRHGMERFVRHVDKPGYMTGDRNDGKQVNP